MPDAQARSCAALLYLFVQLIAGSQRVQDGVLMVWSMQVENVDILSLQPLERRLQLRAHALRLQRLSIPGVRFGGYLN